MRLGIGLGLFKSGLISAGVRIFSAFQTRVIGDGGTVEAGTCVVNAINSSALLQQASLLFIPSGYKGGKLYAEIPTNGNGDLTWTRGGDGFRTNASGLIQRVPWKLYQYSEDFTNALWTKTNVTVSSNTTNAPNGTTSADTLITTATTAQHLLQSISHAVGTFTTSIYAKKGTNNFLQIFNGYNSQAYANFDLNNGVVGTIGSVATATIENVGDGWYRCTLTITSPSSSSFRFELVTSSSAVFAESWNANGTESVFIWGAQLVEGTTAQTYLPTTDRLNFPRLDYTYGSCPAVLLEPQRTNSIRNSTMVGAVTGSPGTLPTNWTNFLSGLSQTVVGVGTENGISYVDLRFNGTASGSTLLVFFETANFTSASSGQSWTLSNYIKLVSSSSGANSYNLLMYERTAVGGYVTEGSATITPSTTLERFVFTRTLTGGVTVAYVQPIFRCNLTSGNSYDFTIRIAQPQMELGAYATTPIFTSGATATRVADSFSRNNIYTNGLITASGGTWFVELRGNVAYTRDNGQVNFALGDTSGGADNSFSIRNLGGGSLRLAIQKYISTANTTLFTTTTDTVKIAIKWNGSTADVFVNGTKQVTATAFTATQLQFLSTFIQVPVFIQQMALYPEPKSDQFCIDLTTL